MAMCRGCGLDTAKHYSATVGWMHYECEIRRLQGLNAEDQAEIARLRALVESAYKEGWQLGFHVGHEDSVGAGPDPWCDGDWDTSEARKILREEK